MVSENRMQRLQRKYLTCCTAEMNECFPSCKRLYLSLKIAIICTFSVISTFCKADTIDVWNVYYNQQLIQNFNGFTANEIVLKLDNIQLGDSITLRYYRDTPCHDCATFLAIENEKHYIFFKRSNRGTGTPISFSVDQLRAIKNKGYIRPFLVFYYEGKLERRSDKMLLFRIRFE